MAGSQAAPTCKVVNSTQKLENRLAVDYETWQIDWGQGMNPIHLDIERPKVKVTGYHHHGRVYVNDHSCQQQTCNLSNTSTTCTQDVCNILSSSKWIHIKTKPAQ